MIHALILAAGASSRMGTPKALLPVPGGAPGAPQVSFVQRVAALAREGGVGGVLVVVGPPHGDAIRRGLPPGVAWAVNPRPERGMLSSVQAGVAALPPRATGALVWPVDMPFVRPDTVRAILDAAPGRIVVPTHEGQGGHPLRLPRGALSAIDTVDLDRGLRGLLAARAAEVVRLPVDDPGVLEDVDDPAALARAKRRAAR